MRLLLAISALSLMIDTVFAHYSGQSLYTYDSDTIVTNYGFDGIEYDTIFDTVMVDYDTVMVDLAQYSMIQDPWIDYVETTHNPTVERISPEEILENKSPAALAYNYVYAIIENDFKKMIENSAPDYKSMQLETLVGNYNGDAKALIKDNFSNGKLGILSWIPALSNGYEVTIAFIQDESTYFNPEDGYWYSYPWDRKKILKNGYLYLPGEIEPRETKVTKKIYVTCSPSSEIYNSGFQDITRYGNTNVKVLVSLYDGEWKVDGFK